MTINILYIILLIVGISIIILLLKNSKEHYDPEFPIYKIPSDRFVYKHNNKNKYIYIAPIDNGDTEYELTYLGK